MQLGQSSTGRGLPLWGFYNLVWVCLGGFFVFLLLGRVRHRQAGTCLTGSFGASKESQLVCGGCLSNKLPRPGYPVLPIESKRCDSNLAQIVKWKAWANVRYIPRCTFCLAAKLQTARNEGTLMLIVNVGA